MAAISGIEHLPAPPPREPRNERSAADFGGAVTHRDKVEEKLRVDPVALAEKKRKTDPARQREHPPPREDNYEEPGSRLDISV